jgi:hypothetical protein
VQLNRFGQERAESQQQNHLQRNKGYNKGQGFRSDLTDQLAMSSASLNRIRSNTRQHDLFRQNLQGKKTKLTGALISGHTAKECVVWYGT